MPYTNRQMRIMYGSESGLSRGERIERQKYYRDLARIRKLEKANPAPKLVPLDPADPWSAMVPASQVPPVEGFTTPLQVMCG